MTSQRPFFSVIVPTYLRPAELPGCLDALARQQFPTDLFEVIVVDDGDVTAVWHRARVSKSPCRQPRHGRPRRTRRGAQPRCPAGARQVLSLYG